MKGDNTDLILTDLGYNLNKVLYRHKEPSTEDLTKIQEITKKEATKYNKFSNNYINFLRLE